MLNLVQQLWLLFCHDMRHWCLHGVALLEPEVFHEHVDMPAIVLIHNSSLFQRNFLFNALVLSVDP